MQFEELLQSGTVRRIVRWGDPVMHRPCRPVSDFGPDLWSLLADMFATNEAAEGAGLAAPQVGVDLAVFIYDCLDGFGKARRGLVCNPVLGEILNPEMDTDLEGCLSLPGAFMPVTRAAIAVVHGQDQLGQAITVRGTGVLARCLQHETDHLNGIVMEDHLTPADRRKLRRQHKQAAAEFPDDWPVGSTGRSENTRG